MADTTAEVVVQIGDEELLAGRMWSHRRRNTESATFAYDAAYLANPLAYGLDPGLPLVAGQQQTAAGRPIFGAFSDCAPDRWGRRLINRAEEHRVRDQGGTERSFGEVNHSELCLRHRSSSACARSAARRSSRSTFSGCRRSSAGSSAQPAGCCAVDLEFVSAACPDHLCLLGLPLGWKQPVGDPVGRRPAHALLLEVDHIKRPGRLELAGLGVRPERLAVSRRVAQVVKQLPGDVTVRLGQPLDRLECRVVEDLEDDPRHQRRVCRRRWASSQLTGALVGCSIRSCANHAHARSRTSSSRSSISS